MKRDGKQCRTPQSWLPQECTVGSGPQEPQRLRSRYNIEPLEARVLLSADVAGALQGIMTHPGAVPILNEANPVVIT